MISRTPDYWPVALPYRPHLRFCSLGNANVQEVMDSFRLACEQLGYSSSSVPDINNTDINLFFFAMGLGWSYDVEMPPNAIVVNFEPALPELLASMPAYGRLLQRAYVWEYSLENMVQHQSLGILRSDYVPLTVDWQATPLLPAAQVLDDAQQDIDVIFFGETTPRRLQVLRALEGHGLRVAYPFGTAWTPAERDALLPRAKVALNMRKLDNSATVEFPRLSILFRHRKAVLSELYPHSEIPAVLRGAMEVCGYDELVDRVRALVADAPRRRELEQAGVDALRSLPPQHRILDAALRRYVAATAQRVACATACTSALSVAPELSRVSVLMVTCNNQAQIVQALDSIAVQTKAADELIVVDDASTYDTVALVRQRMAAAPRLANLRLLQVPCAIGWAGAAQWGLAQASGDWLALCDPTLVNQPERLQVQSAFLQASSDVAATGAWYVRSGVHAASCAPIDGAAEEVQGVEQVQRLPEMHEPILAALLAHQPVDTPLLMGSLMLSLRRVRAIGLGFDATLGAQAWQGLLLELVRDGGRLANMNLALCQRTPSPAAAPVVVSAAVAAAAGEAAHAVTQALAHLRARLLPLLLPHWPADETQRLPRLYGLHWSPDPIEAAALLRDMARACAGKGSVSVDPSVISSASASPDNSADANSASHVAAVLRGEALRMLEVYAGHQLLPAHFIDSLLQDPLLRDFLAPLGQRLYSFNPPRA